MVSKRNSSLPTPTLMVRGRKMPLKVSKNDLLIVDYRRMKLFSPAYKKLQSMNSEYQEPLCQIYSECRICLSSLPSLKTALLSFWKQTSLEIYAYLTRISYLFEHKSAIS